MQKILFFSVVLFFVVSSFLPVKSSSVVVNSCELIGNNAVFNILPGEHYKSDDIRLQINVFSNNKVVALGSQKVLLMNISDRGISCRVPLSGNIQTNRNYKVLVDLFESDAEVKQLSFSNLKAIECTSLRFFQRNFGSMPEVLALRQQFLDI